MLGGVQASFMCNDCLTMPMAMIMRKRRFGRFCKKKKENGADSDGAADGEGEGVSEDSAAAAAEGALERRGYEPGWAVRCRHALSFSLLVPEQLKSNWLKSDWANIGGAGTLLRNGGVPAERVGADARWDGGC